MFKAFPFKVRRIVVSNRQKRAFFKVSMYKNNQADTNISFAGDFNLLKSALKRSVVQLNRITVSKENLEKVMIYYANREI